eukprot:3770549-Alexandrium_andersonii.AAC.1
MRTCTSPSHRRFPSLGCAPSSGAACMARARRRRAGRHCAQRPWRASGLLRAEPARAACTTPSWT